MRLPIALRFYRSSSLPLSCQRLINMYAEPQPKEARAPVALFPTPGPKYLMSVGAGPIRGRYFFNNTLIVVSGQEVYSVVSGLAPVKIGEVAQSGRIQMASNGKQLFILAGTYGFVCDGVSVVPVTDEDWPGATSVTFLDGYFIFSKPASGEFFLCELYDGVDYDALDYATAEANPDRLSACVAYAQRLWNLGEKSIEIYYNSGGEFPFTRQMVLEKGTINATTVAQTVMGIIWVGDDKVVYMAQSTSPQRISDYAIEDILDSITTAEFNNASTWTYEQAGHTFYVLRVASYTFVYDLTTGLWAERESYDGKPWKVGMGEKVFDAIVVGEYEGNKLYTLDFNTFVEDNYPIKRTIIAPLVHAEGSTLSMSSLELECETGVGNLTGEGNDPQVMLKFSDDGGRTFGNEHWRSLGKLGQYLTRVVWRRLGIFRQRVIQITMSEPVKFVVYSLTAEVTPARR
jgi:hypothetical protein